MKKDFDQMVEEAARMFAKDIRSVRRELRHHKNHTNRPPLDLQPITFREAAQFVNNHHSHHKAPQGWLFGTAVNDGQKVVGVIMVGRPVARMLDDGFTAEVIRCCTDGTPDAASKLYGAAARAARALGYKRLITYTLSEETGSSLDAVQWQRLYDTRGDTWDRPGRHRVDKHPTGQKTLWAAPI